MAIKSRLLSKLKFIYMTTTMAAAAHPQKLRPVLHNLEEARELCQQGLTEGNYAKYGEVYEGLIMAVKQILSGEAGKDAGEIVGLCKELLEHIMAETSKEEHFKKEMVFLPYKASMWDSLESVWRAAYEDKDNCLAYVVPIPYCDRNPDGTAKEWHCERDLFPKDVPTLDWQEVDLKTMHPDVIFYHYPYDNCNRVTSVEEIFYSRNIKPCTDELVYIPYFVLGEPEFDYDDPEKAEEIEEAEEKIAHFILEPGVFNADRTIVQSEAMKKVYVNVLTRHTNADREYWEEHILGLGSPKFDKVVESRKEDFELPEEWERIIKGRKTILYNTGLTAMLEHTDKYIEKLQSVLDTFKAQDEVVLWWRPHPLLRPTFEAMHPELLEAYDGIVNGYRQEGWGIYDDTADLDRAVAYTDGYYGDWSSVVQLYEKTGKQVFIQNCTDEHGSLREFNGNTHFMDVAHHGGYMYFSETSFNGLFRCKEGDNKAEFLGRFPGEKLWQGDLHRNVFVRGDKLYFIPMNGHGISVYDCANDTFEMVEIPGAYKEYVHFDYCIEQGEKILLVPLNLDTPFVIFDLQSGGVNILPEISAQIARLVPLPARYEMFSVHCAVYDADYLYLAVSSTNILLKISLEDYQVERKILPIDIHLRYMSRIDGCFYFTAQEHLIASWREEDNSGKIYNMPYEPVDVNYPYLKVVAYKENLYVISGREDRLWKLNPAAEEWTDLLKKAPVGFERDFRGPLLFLGYEQEGKWICLYPRAGNGELLLDLEEEEFSLKSITYAAEPALNFHNDYVRTIFDTGILFFEWELLLSDYIWYMGKGKKYSHKKQEEMKRIGGIIHQSVFEEVRAS